MLVSVPLRGKGRDQRLVTDELDTVPGIARFPSPCGEKVGINTAGTFVVKALSEGEFPSPCGEKVGINILALVSWIDAVRLFPSPCGEKVGINEPIPLLSGRSILGVSVPLRGKGRDQQCNLRIANGNAPVRVSVPLRGKGRDQRRDDSRTLSACRGSFRPLAGKR